MKLEKPDNISSLAVSLFFFAASLGSLTAASYSTFCERLTVVFVIPVLQLPAFRRT